MEMHVLPVSLIHLGLPVKGASLNNAAGGKPAGMFLLAVIVSVSHWVIPEIAPFLCDTSITEVGKFAKGAWHPMLKAKIEIHPFATFPEYLQNARRWQQQQPWRD